MPTALELDVDVNDIFTAFAPQQVAAVYHKREVGGAPDTLININPIILDETQGNDAKEIGQRRPRSVAYIKGTEIRGNLPLSENQDFMMVGALRYDVTSIKLLPVPNTPNVIKLTLTRFAR